MTASTAKVTRPDEKTVLVRVFTHPVCTTCHYAIKMVQELSHERNDLDMRVVSLANENGRNEALTENVRSVPTVIVGKTAKRFIGVPKRTDLIDAIEEEISNLRHNV